MDLFGSSGQQSMTQSPGALGQLAQLLSTIQKRPQAPEVVVPGSNSSVPSSGSGGDSTGSMLGHYANMLGNYLTTPTQLPWQAVDPNNPGTQLPWQQVNPSSAWDMNKSFGSNLSNKALSLLGGMF